MISPTRSGENAACWAWAISCATRIMCAFTSGSRSIQWSTSARGTTSVWPVRIGAIDMNATQTSSRHTNVPGRSPSMMRVKMVGMPPAWRVSARGWGPVAPARSAGAAAGPEAGSRPR